VFWIDEKNSDQCTFKNLVIIVLTEKWEDWRIGLEHTQERRETGSQIHSCMYTLRTS
jgi:hypothetical protein